MKLLYRGPMFKSMMNLNTTMIMDSVFGRAIQSLSKIGDELYFEPLEDGLYLRSVNSCRSAYACFQFSPNFFLHYVDGNTGADETDEALRCKVGMKSIMTVFKSLSTIDKTVEKCRISLNMTEARLVFQMYCRHGIIKTHNLAFIECETLQAVFSKDMCPNKLTAAPKLVCDAVLNFQNNQEEITMIVRPDFVAMKNYVDDEPDPNKVIHTELTLSPDEFDHYQVGLDTDITFCLKEFRAILAFADITALPVTLHFETAGRPVTFSIDSDLSFEANFVLATLADEDSCQAPTTSTASRQAAGKTRNDQKYVRRGAGVRTSSRNGESASSRNSSHPNNVHAERNGKSIKPTASNPGPSRDAPRPSASTDDAFNDNDEYSMAVMDITAPEESMSHSMPAEPSSYPGRRREAEDKDVEGQSTLSDRGDYNGHGDGNGMEENEDDEWGRGVEKANDFTNQYPALSFGGNEGERRGHRSNAERLAQSEEQSSQNEDRLQGRFFRTHEPEHSSTKRSDSASCDGPAVKGKLLSLKSAAASESDSSPVIPVQDPGLAHDSVMQDVEEEEDEEIPATPPSKKFRSVFFGTQSSTQPSQSQQKSAILAPDSDDDD